MPHRYRPPTETDWFFQHFRRDRVDAFTSFGGGFTLAIGLTVIVAWYAHWTAVIQVFPGSPPMKFNTALCFALEGAAVLLLPTRMANAGSWLAGAASLLAFLTGAEYVTHRPIGIDEFFLKSYIDDPTTYAGRMSPLAATCLLLMGIAVLLAARFSASKLALKVAGLISCIVTMTAFVALVGYLFGIEAASGWGSAARMAVQTAAAFLILGSGLLVWTWHAANRIGERLLRWLPLTGSMTLITMVALVSALAFQRASEWNAWRNHSDQVLNETRAFRGDFGDAVRGMRAYVIASQADGLDTFKSGAADGPIRLEQLKTLVSDSPGQEQRLTRLAEDFADVLAYTQKLLKAKETGGLNAAMALESTGEGYALTQQMRMDLKGFEDEEQSLLESRSTLADATLQKTKALLLFGSGAALALLFLANFLTNREIKFRRIAEVELHGIALKQKAILDSANHAIISVDLNGIITSFNGTAERWFGYSADELIGKANPAIFHVPAEVEARAESLSGELGRKIEPGFQTFVAKVSAGKPSEGEWTFIRKDGSLFPVWLSISLLTDLTGNVAGYLGIVADLTERKQAAEKIVKLNEELQRKNLELVNAAQAKNRFLANMSHELRTPLNGIIGFSEIIADGLAGAVNAEQKEYLGDIQNSGQHLLQLINDVLDLARVESGKIELHPEAFSLAQAIDQVCSVIHPLVQKKKIRLATKLASGVDEVTLDQKRLKQVLYNLLSNAVKFTDEGGSVQIALAAEGIDRFTLAVRDSGIGISQENMKRLFNEFEQLDEGITRRYQGTGLGLALTRRIVEMQHGTIKVESEFGKGSTFLVSLPLCLEKVGA